MSNDEEYWQAAKGIVTVIGIVILLELAIALMVV